MSDMEINSKTIGIEEFDFDEEITTQWGGKIIPRNDEWFLENHNINFRKLARLSTNSFVERFKIVLAYRSMRYAYRTITNDFNRCFELLNCV